MYVFESALPVRSLSGVAVAPTPEIEELSGLNRSRRRNDVSPCPFLLVVRWEPFARATYVKTAPFLDLRVRPGQGRTLLNTYTLRDPSLAQFCPAKRKAAAVCLRSTVY